MGILGKKHKEIGKVVLLPLNHIVSNPNQPRKYFDTEAIQELSRSIAQNGLLQPVTVRRLPGDRYELIAGERRTMAFRSLGEEYIPGIVEEYTGGQSAVMALVENLQRKNLNYFEEAVGIATLMEELGLSQMQVSQKLGKAQSTVANKLRLLKYSPVLREKMLAASLTERHARALLKITDDQILENLVEHIIINQLNVEQTERYIENLSNERKRSKNTRIFVVKDMRIFQNTIHKAVDLMRESGIDVDMATAESEEFLEYTLKIPKSAIYRSKQLEPVNVAGGSA